MNSRAEAMNQAVTSQPSATAETPSGKGAGDENFPVGSFLLPRRLRPHVAVYYAFARAIDDIADNPALAPGEKIVRLDGFDKALCGETSDPGFIKAIRARAMAEATGVPLDHMRDLIVAFKQDAVKLRYRNWAELRNYCRYSASPVGRFLLDLHGEARSGWLASDALCDALQVLNHLQDCKADYLALNRVYLPMEWMGDARVTVEQLAADRASPGLRKVIDQCLDATAALLEVARPLPDLLKSRRLAMESATIVNIADALLRKLRRQDPVAGRVQLSRLEFIGCGLRGVVRAPLGRRPIAAASGGPLPLAEKKD
jgi:squalene synthase HpnC